MYFEEFSAGQRFKLAPVTMTADEIHQFAERYDPQPIHVDPAFAEQGTFKGIIASGFHSLAVIWAEWIRTGRFGTEIIGGTGMDYIRWLAPVRPGDTLFSVVEVVETIPSARGGRGQIALQFTVRNQHDVIVAETVGRAYLKARS